ncbi:OmpH family outer membrane protein [Desulfonatronum sp. SC1]|uniref:OmpH family outer membrane protein n=1 Tax=Desulfonatronum sp. SC1 TaxID=2109626 RepID=UPI000D2FFD16|nr:OmpH family outer membrane protein [Desulfonatronum sp. SC1]PTN38892.1 molecular chaperone Skp [Desulfonatronum sp. SC1]
MRLYFRVLLLATLLLMIGVSAPAWAQVKVGILDMQAIIAESVPGQEAMSELRTRFESMKGELDTQNETITKLRDELQRQSMVLSQEAQQDKELEYRRKVRDFQDQFQAFQVKMKTEEDRLSEPILDLLLEVINTYGKQNKFTMIIDGNASGLVYADDAVVITDAVKEELNKAWRAR